MLDFHVSAIVASSEPISKLEESPAGSSISIDTAVLDTITTQLNMTTRGNYSDWRMRRIICVINALFQRILRFKQN